MKNYKFKAILTSQLPTHIKDENGDRQPVKLDNTNELLENIKACLPHQNSIVVMAKNPSGYELNDFIAEGRFESFRMSGFHFKEEIVLDNRNMKDAKKIIKNASVIVFLGGKITHQQKFFKKIHLKRLLKNFKGLIISVSTGTMHVCKKVYNYPEAANDLGEPLLIKGLGLFDEYIIPHFDGKKYSYQYDGIDVANDYLIPFSNKHLINAIPDNSYYLYNGKELKLYGDGFLIKNETTYEKI